MSATPQVCRHSTAGAFLARAESWLLDTEMENAFALESARHARRDDSHYERPVFWATIEDDAQIIGCAFRTPPYRVGVTALPETAIEPLVASLREFYRTLSGVAGPETTASSLASAWAERHGGTWTVLSRQRLLSVDSSMTPSDSPPHGSLRLALPEDIGVAQSWGNEAARDSGLGGLDGAYCARLLRARQLYFWADGGTPRCMLGVLRNTPQSAAAGIVYTPAALRNRGYATVAIAAWSRGILHDGKRCFLYTDPANAALGAIAQKLGCRTVQNTVDIDFH